MPEGKNATILAHSGHEKKNCDQQRGNPPEPAARPGERGHLRHRKQREEPQKKVNDEQDFDDHRYLREVITRKNAPQLAMAATVSKSLIAR